MLRNYYNPIVFAHNGQVVPPDAKVISEYPFVDQYVNGLLVVPFSDFQIHYFAFPGDHSEPIPHEFITPCQGKFYCGEIEVVRVLDLNLCEMVFARNGFPIPPYSQIHIVNQYDPNLGIRITTRYVGAEVVMTKKDYIDLCKPSPVYMHIANSPEPMPNTSPNTEAVKIPQSCGGVITKFSHFRKKEIAARPYPLPKMTDYVFSKTGVPIPTEIAIGQINIQQTDGKEEKHFFNNEPITTFRNFVNRQYCYRDPECIKLIRKENNKGIYYSEQLQSLCLEGTPVILLSQHPRYDGTTPRQKRDIESTSQLNCDTSKQTAEPIEGSKFLKFSFSKKTKSTKEYTPLFMTKAPPNRGLTP